MNKVTISNILTGVSVIGVGATVFFATKEAPNFKKTQDELKAKGASKKERFISGVKTMKFTIISGAATVTAIVGGQRCVLSEVHKLSADIASMSTAYVTATKQLEAHKKVVEEVVGKEKADEIESKTHERTKAYDTTTNANSICPTGYGDQLFFIPFGNHWFRSTLLDVHEDMDRLNKDIEKQRFASRSSRHITMQDICDYLNIESTITDELISVSDKYDCIAYSTERTTMGPNHEPAIVLDISERSVKGIDPEYEKNFRVW